MPSNQPSNLVPLLVDHRTLARLDLCYLVALDAAGKNSLVPQLFEVLGQDAAIKFMQCFAGMTIRVPSLISVKSTIKDLSVYDKLDKVDRTDAEAVKRIADEAGKTPEQALETYDRVKRLAKLVSNRPQRRAS